MPKKTTDLDKTPPTLDDDDFDIDAWIDGASTETQTVRIYRNLGKLGEYQRLAQEFEHLQVQLGDLEDAGGNPDAALGEATPQTKLVELAPRMKQVYDTLQADALWVTVRGFGDDELDAMRKAVDKGTEPKDKKSEALAFRLISDGATFRTDNGHEFTMSAKKLRAFRNAIGDKQFNKITGAAYQVNGFNGDTDVVMPDFSPGASVYLATKES